MLFPLIDAAFEAECFLTQTDTCFVLVNVRKGSSMSMYCFQCEQTANSTGCTQIGVCGKRPTTAALQDKIVQTVKEIGYCNHHLKQNGLNDRSVDRFMLELLFATVTNVNFDNERLNKLLQQAKEVRDGLLKQTSLTLPSPVEKRNVNEDSFRCKNCCSMV